MMRRIIATAAGLLLAAPLIGGEFKSAIIKSVGDRYEITMVVDGKEMPIRPGLFFTAFDERGQELPAFQHYRVLVPGNVVDVQTRPNPKGEETIQELRLIKGTLRPIVVAIAADGKLLGPDDVKSTTTTTKTKPPEPAPAKTAITILGFRNNNVSFKSEKLGTVVTMQAPATGTFTGVDGKPASREMVLATGNVVELIYGKDGNFVAGARLVRANPDAPPPQPDGPRTIKGAVVRGYRSDVRVVILTAEGDDARYQLLDTSKVLDLDGKEVTGPARGRVFTRGNVLDISMTPNKSKEATADLLEARLVKGEAPPPPSNRKVQEFKDIPVVTKSINGRSTFTLTIDGKDVRYTINDESKLFDDKGDAAAKSVFLKAGVVVDAKLEMLPMDRAIVVEMRLKKK